MHVYQLRRYELLVIFSVFYCICKCICLPTHTVIYFPLAQEYKCPADLVSQELKRNIKIILGFQEKSKLAVCAILAKTGGLVALFSAYNRKELQNPNQKCLNEHEHRCINDCLKNKGDRECRQRKNCLEGGGNGYFKFPQERTSGKVIYSHSLLLF